MSDPRLAGAILTIDLSAIRANYRQLLRRSAPATCAAVVKANAYGLGVERVAPALAAEGCRVFFVATIGEGLALRRVLGSKPDTGGGGSDASIFILGGATVAGAEGLFSEHRLIPVINALGEAEAWAGHARRTGREVPVALHIDTGMSRLGLPASELDTLCREPERLHGLALRSVMSHLACADEPENEMNRMQLEAFLEARRRLPPAPASFANSSGIFLGPGYHMHLTRPGVALYGGAPSQHATNPMAQVVRLQGKILQVREIDRGWPVGYGAQHRAARRERVATVAVGYADGYLRSLSNIGGGYIDGTRVPVVGRVSMDLVTFDVSGVPAHRARPGEVIDLIGPHNPIDTVAGEAETIAYEILTALGPRYHRVYAEAGA